MYSSNRRGKAVIATCCTIVCAGTWFLSENSAGANFTSKPSIALDIVTNKKTGESSIRGLKIDVTVSPLNSRRDLGGPKGSIILTAGRANPNWKAPSGLHFGQMASGMDIEEGTGKSISDLCKAHNGQGYCFATAYQGPGIAKPTKFSLTLPSSSGLNIGRDPLGLLRGSLHQKYTPRFDLIATFTENPLRDVLSGEPGGTHSFGDLHRERGAAVYTIPTLTAKQTTKFSVAQLRELIENTPELSARSVNKSQLQKLEAEWTKKGGEYSTLVTLLKGKLTD
jgi:hypothetical protein